MFLLLSLRPSLSHIQAEDSSDRSTHNFEPGQARWFLPPLPLLLSLVVLMAAPLEFRLAARGRRCCHYCPAIGQLASLHCSPWLAQLAADGICRTALLFALSLALERAVPQPLDHRFGAQDHAVAGPAHIFAGLFVLALRRTSLPPDRLVAPAMAGVGQWFSPCRFGCLWLAGLEPQGTCPYLSRQPPVRGIQHGGQSHRA